MSKLEIPEILCLHLSFILIACISSEEWLQVQPQTVLRMQRLKKGMQQSQSLNLRTRSQLVATSEMLTLADIQ